MPINEEMLHSERLRHLFKNNFCLLQFGRYYNDELHFRLYKQNIKLFEDSESRVLRVFFPYYLQEIWLFVLLTNPFLCTVVARKSSIQWIVFALFYTVIDYFYYCLLDGWFASVKLRMGELVNTGMEVLKPLTTVPRHPVKMNNQYIRSIPAGGKPEIRESKQRFWSQKFMMMQDDNVYSANAQ
ncbi:hypothetical protein [Asticcacaulis sp.]|uniref:hypothetical protein n=1 Tax=Asticcacaulis sp. TaxID=1872648 RepID=UPI002C6A8756|nr:hypothetical protein [Asticcacaulis sp.]HTM82092.1 hypothetical protein [Asticcacaulis sp.]